MATNPNFEPTPIREEKALVPVFDTNDEAEALVVQGLLESNGIESLLSNLDAPQDVFPGVGGAILRVRPSDAEEALSIIEAQRNDQPAEGESSEAEIP
jgi:Putative prokaryotic signal transducing protein